MVFLGLHLFDELLHRTIEIAFENLLRTKLWESAVLAENRMAFCLPLSRLSDTFLRSSFFVLPSSFFVLRSSFFVLRPRNDFQVHKNLHIVMRGAGRKPGPEHSYNFVSLSSPKSGKSRG
jgi:hypothetical protein